MDRQIRILIADDHPILRDGLRKLLESEADFAVAGEAANGHETLELTRRLEPDVLLLDVAMPGLSGLEVLRALTASSLSTRTILLTADIESSDIVKALQLGARGLVLKESASQLLMKAIRTVMAGQYWISRDGVSQLVDLFRALTSEAGDRKYGLTPRELKIIEAVAAGYTNKDIAQRLSLSEETVKHRLSKIFDKVGVSNRLELALLAISQHLVDRS